jgi:hypothetical protein
MQLTCCCLRCERETASSSRAADSHDGGLPLARRRQGRFVLQVRAGPGLVAPSARGAAMVPSSGPAGAAKPERRGRLGNMRANIA